MLLVGADNLAIRAIREPGQPTVPRDTGLRDRRTTVDVRRERPGGSVVQRVLQVENVTRLVRRGAPDLKSPEE